MKRIAHVSPALIPHTLFHTGIWLQSVKRPDWYYFKKKRSGNTISNKDFAASLDKPLAELVKYLHKNGIKTTPSCSGHDMKERDLEQLYAGMEADAEEIRNGGLVLKDVETGRVYLYADKNYELPWSKTSFLDDLAAYQHKGVLGLRLGHRRKMKQQLLALKIEGVKIEERNGIVFILTNEHNQHDIRTVWQHITAAVIAVMPS